ncbi:MAG TPA: iron-sulfur cluster assembly scaffold protein [Phycisphaerales bacterium]|nr:iron-sulfur cluster assembly scaffold protein [Phycisphaerales bacterium]
MYSSTLREHATNPHNRREMESPTAKGSATYNRCGDKLTMYFQITEDTITECTFTARGCGPMIAAASLASTIFTGQTVEQAKKLSIIELHNTLGGMPVSKRHALLLVLQCLAEALGAPTQQTKTI